MMQLYPLLVMAIVLAGDSEAREQIEGMIGSLQLSPRGVVLWSVVPVVVFLLFAWIGAALCRRQLSTTGRARWFVLAERMTRSTRWLLLLQHTLAVFVLGALDVVRHWIGDLILVDELLVASVPLLGVIATWWIDYPSERRMREAVMVRRLDEGRPMFALPGRAAFVWLQTRVQLLPLLVPIVAIIGLGEGIRRAALQIEHEQVRFWLTEGGTLLAGLIVFLFAPVMVRYLLSVKPMPAGPTRDALEEVCRQHKVRVRQILFWNTGGTIVNAAVMGLVGPLRYVMLTDALIETLDRRQLTAVMAHEIGHVRRHHMPWMLVVLFALVVTASILVWLPAAAASLFNVAEISLDTGWAGAAGTIIAIVLIFFGFGWISRRFERQADTFAVQHLSHAQFDYIETLKATSPALDEMQDLPDAERIADAAHESGWPLNEDESEQGVGQTESRALQHKNLPEFITPEAVSAMLSALSMIARLNMVNPDRPSWRHGSISWRQSYLRSLIGRTAARLPIDGVVRMIKIAAAAVIGLAICGEAAMRLIEADGVGGMSNFALIAGVCLFAGLWSK